MDKNILSLFEESCIKNNHDKNEILNYAMLDYIINKYDNSISTKNIKIAVLYENLTGIPAIEWKVLN